MRRHGLLAALTLAAVVVVGGPIEAYLKLGIETGSESVAVAWGPGPIRYFITDRDVPGVSAEAFRAAVGRAFDSWQAVPMASATFEEVGFTLAPPSNEDGMTTLGFEDRADLDARIVAVTSFLLEVTTGEIVEGDIAFNTASAWSVAADFSGFDVESIAVHEIGHLLGLGHSAIGETELLPSGRRRVLAAETVMFPLAFLIGTLEGRTLRPDDIAGISDLYPTGGFREQTGSIAGTVQRDGVNVVGAHVLAFQLESGRLVANFSLSDDGRYVIAGLEPGLYIVRVEPLDDADLNSFFNDVGPIDIDFQTAFADDIVIVTAGTTAIADVQVMAK